MDVVSWLAYGSLAPKLVPLAEGGSPARGIFLFGEYLPHP